MNDQPPTRPPCGNCGKPALWLLDNFPVCIDCKYKFDQTQWMQFAQNAAMINYLEREMSDSVGLRSSGNSIVIPRAPIPPINYNNQSVTVSGGTVGAINFGSVQEIQVSLQSLNETGDASLVEAMREFAEVLLNANDVSPDAKNEILEQAATLTAQAAEKPEARKLGTVKAVFAALKEGASAIGSVADAWKGVEPLVRNHFGF